MDERSAPCKALVLAGGGARGSYQVGVWRALMELDWHPQIITGTSVGSLNGAMFVLDQYETARDMWLAIRSKDVMELPEEDADLSALHQFLRSVVKAGGMDVTPLEEIVERVLDEDALRAAPIRFGLVTVEQRGLKPRELTLDEIPAGKVKDYLMASAACFPALRAREIDGVKFLDGGYSDNMPTGLAKRMGADELVCVDLEGVGITRPNLTGLPTVMVRSYWELGDILLLFHRSSSFRLVRSTTAFLTSSLNWFSFASTDGRSVFSAFLTFLPVYSVKAAVSASASRPLKKIRYLGGELLRSFFTA